MILILLPKMKRVNFQNCLNDKRERDSRAPAWHHQCWRNWWEVMWYKVMILSKHGKTLSQDKESIKTSLRSLIYKWLIPSLQGVMKTNCRYLSRKIEGNAKAWIRIWVMKTLEAQVASLQSQKSVILYLYVHLLMLTYLHLPIWAEWLTILAAFVGQNCSLALDKVELFFAISPPQLL